MALALDSNVILYSVLEPTTARGVRALDLVERLPLRNCLIAAQVLGEVMAVVRRRRPELFGLAIETTHDLLGAYRIADTNEEVIREAARIAQRYGLQIWDAVMVAASLHAGATHLLTEDMQDGMRISGLRLINPFVDANQAEIERLLLPPA